MSLMPTFQASSASTAYVCNVTDSHTKTTLPAIPSIIPPTPRQASYPQDIPPRVVKKILNLEYIEMAELLPEYWGTEEPESPCCTSQLSKSSRRSPVTDILVWLDCYASLVSVLCSVHPHKFSHFMAYQRTIIRAHRMFVGDRWVIYDACYRRAAANTKLLDWGIKDNDLYNETFTGRAKAISRCSICLSELHPTAECPQGSHSSTPSASHGGQFRTPRSDAICLLYNHRNGDRCTFTPCKYGHFCKECGGRHPVTRCSKQRRPYPTADHRPRKKN